MIGVTDTQLMYVRKKCGGMCDADIAREFGVTRSAVYTVARRFYKKIGAVGMTSPDSFACYVLGTIDERRRAGMEMSVADALLQAPLGVGRASRKVG